MRKLLLLVPAILLSGCFFGGSTTLLTEQPINIASGWVEIPIKEPLHGLISEASVQVDVSNVVSPNLALKDIGAFFAAMNARFPKGCMQGRIEASDGRHFMLLSTPSSVSKTQNLLGLYAAQGLPTDVTFIHLSLRASCSVDRVNVYWMNWAK